MRAEFGKELDARIQELDTLASMTTIDQTHWIDDILSEPMLGRSWVVGSVARVDRARHECEVSGLTGEHVIVCYRPRDEPAILAAHRDSGGTCLKAIGVSEYQPGSVLSRILQVERLCDLPREEAERLTFLDLWNERSEMVDPSVWSGVPADVAEHHDEYLAREYHNDD